MDRRERLRRLALETIDLSKDPYFMRNHLGQYECRLCLTLHNNEGNYLAHTQGGRGGAGQGGVVCTLRAGLRGRAPAGAFGSGGKLAAGGAGGAWRTCRQLKATTGLRWACAGAAGPKSARLGRERARQPGRVPRCAPQASGTSRTWRSARRGRRQSGRCCRRRSGARR